MAWLLDYVSGLEQRKELSEYDDAAMAVSFVGFVIFVAMELVAIHYGIGATVVEPGLDMITAAKYFTIAQIVYILTTGISKIGVASVLYRLASNADMYAIRVTRLVSMVVVGGWSFASAIIFAIQCRPLSVAWGVGTGTCLSTELMGNAAYALSAMDVASGWLYALLPVFMLYKAQIKLKLKIGIIILLGLGALSSIATIIRLRYIVLVQSEAGTDGLAAQNVIEWTLTATIYSIFEIALSILAAALTALRPLLKSLPCFSDLSSGGKSGTMGYNSSRGATGQIKGPSYRLDDMNPSRGHGDGDSQERIISSSNKTMNIQKVSRVEVSYGSPESRRQAERGW